MKDSIDAVAFDIDGTLYADWRLYIRIVPYFIKNLPFFLQFNKVRKVLHKTAPLPDFYEYQARLLAENMQISVIEARECINRIVYKGLQKYFRYIKPFPHVEETFKVFKEAGYKIGILSDFPPSQKGTIWGLSVYCDAILGSEECGALKPSKYAFGLLARELNVDMSRILYVGNSRRCDIAGAKKAGMKTAFIMPWWRAVLNLKVPLADICFKNYRKLQKLVLK